MLSLSGHFYKGNLSYNKEGKTIDIFLLAVLNTFIQSGIPGI
jgi:hypothetical protein